MFRTILIANRGEIACRVIATARCLGIRSVAVYSEADAHARHVELADEAIMIGPAPARESYLAIDAIIEAARRSGAEAIHPGYGFLSENADFAQACLDAGIAFVGPPPAAIRAMGSKAAAKALMAQAGVPVVPGYHGAAQTFAALAEEAARIGYPVLIKASAGGGGRGMRVVADTTQLEEAITGARREALAAFGDDRLLIETYLERPRHIEVQIFADTHGNAVSLFERDCSIQRRHQKVIEEAPAPGIDETQRRALGVTAVTAARAVGYVGAGTVEFIAERGRFYFMEMNTRLQVEHPVTEMITGQDLVEWQLRVACGEALPLRQEQLTIRGHAIEARVYAEDPEREFLPSIGNLVHLRQPRDSAHIRVDTGARAGDAITPHYDAMIAKLIAWGEDRAEALRHLAAALAEYEIVGVRTNLDLLRAIAAHPAFVTADFDTGFIALHNEALLAAPRPDRVVAWAACAMAVLAEFQDRARALAQRAGDPWSPWSLGDAWRMNGEGYQDLLLRDGEETIAIRAHPGLDGSFLLDMPSGSVHVTAATHESGMALRVNGVLHRARVVPRGEERVVILAGRNHALRMIDPLVPPRLAETGSDRLVAPIPARIARVLVASGDCVAKGAPLLVLEAMKTELTLRAPAEGIVAAVHHEAGAMVEEGVELVTFAP